MKHIFFCIIFSLVSIITVSQDMKKSNLKPYKIGLLHNNATNENYLNDDLDYTYSTSTYKFQAFYELGNWLGLDIDVIVQPQIQFLKHQLINSFYVTPDVPNFQEKIDEFTQPKKMNLYALEFGFAAKRKLLKKVDIQGTISLGFSFIDKRTERLAKGFTFIENLSLGFSFNALKNSFIYFGSNVGHVSNLNFQKPNDGYNIVGYELGFSYILN